MIPRLAITPGEPAGIGPELVVRLAAQPRASQWVVIADGAWLARTARDAGVALELLAFEPAAREIDPPGVLRIVDVPLPVAPRPGVLEQRNARAILETLERATDGCLDGCFDALVTGPVHKGVIADAGFPFSGHTEFLAERCGVESVLMVLTADALRVALVTTHVPLSAVPALITRERVARALELLHAGLRERYAIDRPRILVAGLNPHAGEGGHLGREEIEVIGPVCDAARASGMDVRGPLPADTLFTPALLAEADAVLAMYHDQGLPVLKHLGFGRAVNVTFGLPIVRTSVDHGTALDIAGRHSADTGSLAEAVAAAETMVLRRRRDAA
ncbi:MAG: 4-hydroxythreonine-4-phosphate dehydrogenase PdxA [Pseudomonadales bacterium]|jgi:4-hydroxythreonine-4-phosphate dehydrogenase|nr:4-hydroxythreonine-4-phosphate dehydrogenase PdxA [Pseudomonadales bacterium]